MKNDLRLNYIVPIWYTVAWYCLSGLMSQLITAGVIYTTIMLMKRNLFHFTRWSISSSQFDDILRVKAKTAIAKLFTKFKIIAGGSISENFLKEAQILAIKLKVIRKDQGIKGLCLYLKSSSIALQQSLAGYRIDNMTLVGPRISRTKSGLPRCIPKKHRLCMINRGPGCYFLMKYYLSIFYLYRILKFPGKVNIETITDPGGNFNIDDYKVYLENFVRLLLKTQKVSPLEFMRSRLTIFPITRKSPFTNVITYDPFEVNKKSRKETGSLWSTHVVSMLEAVRCLKSSSIYLDVIDHLKILKFSKLLDYLSYAKGLKFTELGPVGPIVEWGKKTFKFPPYSKPMGKLSLKEEAAGKVRVFAMVDPVTQWALAPLHKFLFRILRTLPMDGTFNQLRPIYRLLRSNTKRGLYSLDLSAATDRLPVSLQAEFLNILVKDVPGFGSRWSRILVNRDYHLSSKTFEIDQTVRYSVGQPMGALSSWAMLATIHHFIVQMAAWESGFPMERLFKDYAVLGDDLVLADHKVKRKYLKILKDLWVKCGLHKSILSPKGKGLEFAKSTFIDGQNVSPISLDELSVSLTDLAAWSAFSKKFSLSWERQMRILDFGFLARRKSFKKMNHAMQLIYLSQIAKADFNTDVLKLKKSFPDQMLSISNDVLQERVLFPLFAKLIKMYKDHDQWLYNQLVRINTTLRPQFKEFDVYDVRNSFDLVLGLDMGGKGSQFPNKIQDLIKKFFPHLLPDDVKALLYFNFDIRVAKWLISKSGVTSLNETLDLYFKLNSELGKLSLQFYGLDSVRALPSVSKIPSQARMFREWSLISHKIVSIYRASKEKSTEIDP